MDKGLEYTILQDTTCAKLAQKVTDHLKNGFKLFGEMRILTKQLVIEPDGSENGVKYYQVMIKE